MKVFHLCFYSSQLEITEVTMDIADILDRVRYKFEGATTQLY